MFHVSTLVLTVISITIDLHHCKDKKYVEEIKNKIHVLYYVNLKIRNLPYITQT